eukprot:TRINITY_DN3161_c0_g2_i1.p1 TRINITY_DN3161_c0_g2~~TRINITY_DN3161_c0_g2_i1.p1  ORF type:complete len:1868 (+),score=480.55 TRINITY_DN3161_c0_g2_i1:49-5652(+)
MGPPPPPTPPPNSKNGSAALGLSGEQSLQLDDLKMDAWLHSSSYEIEPLKASQSPHASGKFAGFGLAETEQLTPVLIQDEPGWHDSMRQGYGRIETPGYGIYEGQVRENQAAGEGRFTGLNGDTYNGQWLCDKKHGRGTYRNAEGASYEGEWVEDLKSGKGMETRPDGSTYEGQSWRGKKHGHGLYKSADRTMYDGQFAMDSMDGEGRCTFADGRVYTGQWQHNRMSGEGRMLWPNGQLYMGQYVSGQKSGVGTFKWPDGRAYTGQWVQGKQHGRGTYTDSEAAAWSNDWENGRKACESAPATFDTIAGADPSSLLWSMENRKQKSELQLQIEKGELHKDLLRDLGGARHGIASGAFRFFERQKLVAKCDWGSAEERAQVAWSLRECNSVFQDEQFEPFFVFVATALLADKTLLTSYEQLSASNAGSGLQDMRGRSYLTVAWLAQDLHKQWSLLSTEDRKFFEDAGTRLLRTRPWATLQLQELQGLLDRVRGRFIICDRTIRNLEPKLALHFLTKTPAETLCARFEAAAADGAAPKASFFDLYEPFVQIGDYEAAEVLVSRLADAFRACSSDPSDALQSFMLSGISQEKAAQKEATNGMGRALLQAARNKRDFLISFVSAWHMRENRKAGADKLGEPKTNPQASPRRMGNTFTFGWPMSSPKAKKTPARKGDEDESRLSLLSGFAMQKDFDIIFIEFVLEDFSSRQHSLTIGDVERIKETFEAALLVSTGDNLYNWATKLDMLRAETLVRLLEKIAAKHVAEVLRTCARDGNYKYDNAQISRLVSDVQKWAHDHLGTRFFSERRQPRKGKCAEVCQLLRMYVKLDLALGGKTIYKFMKSLEEDSHRLDSFTEEQSYCMAVCFDKIAPVDSAIRTAVQKEVRRTLPPDYLAIDDIQRLLSYTAFFSGGYQSLLRSQPSVQALRSGLKAPVDCKGLLMAAVKVLSVKGARMKDSPEALIVDISNMCKAHAFTLESMRKVCDAVIRQRPKDFLPDDADKPGFTISSFHECASRLQLASEVIVFRSRGGKNITAQLVERVKSVVDSFLRSDPCTWESNLGKLDTIVFFLEYMGKEDLSLAYEKFFKDIRQAVEDVERIDEKAKFQQLEQLLECVKTVYREPLVTLDFNNTDIGELHRLDIAKVISNSAQRIDQAVHWCGLTFTPEDWDDIVEIVGTTAAAMREHFNVLMLPHHTQLITLIMCAIRTCGVGLETPSLPKTMLGRVGTGEGKSWIIGMLAAFVVKRGRRIGTGLRAHVVIDNGTLKSRDFDTVSLFFEKLGITASKFEEHLQDERFEVVYCTGAEIWSQCRSYQEQGKSGEFEEALGNAVLIVDEVDGLIIDGDANIQYMYPDDVMSQYADHWLRLLENGYNPEDPREADELLNDELKVAFRKVEDAYNQAKSAELGRDFEWREGFMYMLDKSTGMIKVGWWDLWYEIKYWMDTEWEGSVTYKCIKSILCKKHCFTSYSCIFGLTGSLGQRAEQNFLATHYDAAVFNVPYFLDTCRSDDGKEPGKPVVKSLNTGDIVQPDEENQISRVVELAMSKCGDVPVLVIAKDQAKVDLVAKRLREQLPDSREEEEPEGLYGAGSRIIKLLEDPGNPDKFVKLVDAATQPYAPAGKNGKKAWRITVTTAEGGRGHDYRVVDPAVDEKGGLLLILMWVSWSQREWVQFLGRTARQDHEGQVAVYLNAQSKEIFDLEQQDIDLSDGERVVSSILRAGDDKMKARCDKVGNDISRGTMMHKLTSRYWRTLLREGSTTPKQENVWRKLCREYLLDIMSEEDISKIFDGAFQSEDAPAPSLKLATPMQIQGPESADYPDEVEAESTGLKLPFLDFIMRGCQPQLWQKDPEESKRGRPTASWSPGNNCRRFSMSL